MGTLSAKQVHELGNQFLAMGRAIGDYRYRHFDDMDAGLNNMLKDLYWSVLNTADALFTTSATLVMDDVESSLATIERIGKKIQATYKTLQNVQHAIDHATRIVALGVAILEKDPGAIKEALTNMKPEDDVG